MMIRLPRFSTARRRRIPLQPTDMDLNIGQLGPVNGLHRYGDESAGRIVTTLLV